MSSALAVLQNDLKNATVKEIVDCMRAVNEELGQKLLVSGKKDEIIQRFSTYIVGLVSNNKRPEIASVVRIVNDAAPRKLSWKYDGEEIKVNCQPSARAPTSSIDSITFVPSPFIKPIFRLTTVKICPSASQARQSKGFTFLLNDANRQLLATPNACDDRPPFQIRFYCARYSNGKTENLLVEFPSICELKVNDCTIPGHNLRCIKGKPGTVNPPDVSIMSKKHAQNSIELVYINSGGPFIASAYIVERTPVQTLIEDMKKNRVLTKESVLEKLRQKQEDADVIMESESVSTKCPLAFTRIHTPIRSKQCNHLQCFDANTFLTMNEQTPTWSCPVCHRRIDFWEDLIVDEYFTEMLQMTPKHIDNVRIGADGVAQIELDPEKLQEPSSEDEDSDDEQHQVKKEEVTILLDDDDSEDDIITTTTPNTQTARRRTSAAASTTNNNNSIPVASTSNASSSSSSTTRVLTPDVSNSPQPPKKKQKTSNVIDLTLSSDEEDDDDAVQFTSSSSTSSAATAAQHQTNGAANQVPPLQEVSSLSQQEEDQNMSSSSQNESLILPHTGTLYNGTSKI